MKILVTGGLGFIGINFIKKLITYDNVKILNIDNLSKFKILNSKLNFDKKKYFFKKIDICNYNLLKKVFFEFQPNFVINFAAETHVDNSISDPFVSIQTNIFGTYNLLEISRIFLEAKKNYYNKFKFIHISTDEVYGSLQPTEKSSTEESQYKPNSPYSASKASSDHLVRAWYKTYKIPTLITHCTNNYGPFQFYEKLVPKTIKHCFENKSIPIYGNGQNVRDWIHVSDHVDYILQIMFNGQVGSTYNIGSNSEIANIDLVKIICKFFDSFIPKDKSHLKLIKFVKDRKGHDQRYSLDIKKIKKELKIVKKRNLEDGLKETIIWYLENKDFFKDN